MTRAEPAERRRDHEVGHSVGDGDADVAFDPVLPVEHHPGGGLGALGRPEQAVGEGGRDQPLGGPLEQNAADRVFERREPTAQGGSCYIGMRW